MYFDNNPGFCVVRTGYMLSCLVGGVYGLTSTYLYTHKNTNIGRPEISVFFVVFDTELHP